MEKKIEFDLVSPKRVATPEDPNRCRTSRAAAAVAAEKIRNGILNLTSPIDMENAKEPADIVLRENDTVITNSNKKKRKRAEVVASVKVVPCVEESWEAAAIEKEDSKNMRKLIAKYKGKLFRDKVKGVWEDRVIIGVLWINKYRQYFVITDLTSGKKDEAEYDISSVRGLIT